MKQSNCRTAIPIMGTDLNLMRSAHNSGSAGSQPIASISQPKPSLDTGPGKTRLQAPLASLQIKTARDLLRRFGDNSSRIDGSDRETIRTYPHAVSIDGGTIRGLPTYR